jgi:hypothetical protein
MEANRPLHLFSSVLLSAANQFAVNGITQAIFFKANWALRYNQG